MTLRSEKIFSVIWVAVGELLCFEALAYILNLNQIWIYVYLAFAIALYLSFKIVFFFDLHFKTRGKFSISLWLEYVTGRVEHFMHWRTLRHWINCMGMPTLLYWATVAIIFLNFNRVAVQQLFVIVSTLAFSFYFWHLKEIYRNQGENMSESAHVALQAIKIYSAFTIFLASLGLVQYFCLSYWSLGPIVFVGVFTLMYQSLFHMQQINPKTIASLGVISLIMAMVAGLVYLYWGLSYTTGALFLMGIHNFFWGNYYYYLRGKLSVAIFLEFLLVTLLICGLSVGTTNFRARIIPYC